MKKFILASLFFLTGCNPQHTSPNASLYTIKHTDIAAYSGWCDLPEPEYSPAVFYEWQGENCVSQVK